MVSNLIKTIWNKYNNLTDDTKETINICIGVFLFLWFCNIPQWLFCYVRQVIFPFETTGIIESITYVKDKNQSSNDDILEFFNKDNNYTATINLDGEIKKKYYGVISAKSYNTDSVKILVNEKEIKDFIIYVDKRNSNFLIPKNFLIYEIGAGLHNLKKGNNTLTLITINKYQNNKETKAEYKIIINTNVPYKDEEEETEED